MKTIEKYRAMGLLSENDVFDYLMKSLKDTIRTYDFFVAWEKVLNRVANVEISLNILNSIIGKDNLGDKLKELIKLYPQVVPVLPLLIAVRESVIKVADLGGDIAYSFNSKQCYSDNEIDNIVYFLEKCGLLKILSDKSIKNLVDYTVGVEVGLDTNARKNRSGAAMEALTEIYVKALCEKRGYHYLTQATAERIKTVFNKTVTTDKADRHFDFVVDTKSKIYLIEVNYYGGGGSKLKSVAGEFKTLFNLVKNDSTQFLWVTDGVGWHTARRPLLETFNSIDFVMNIKMIEDGLMEEVIIKGL